MKYSFNVLYLQTNISVEPLRKRYVRWQMLFFQVHVVKDVTRGATLEVVVSRMKAVHASRTAQNPETGLSMRFVAVSATIPNTSDVSCSIRESMKVHSAIC